MQKFITLLVVIVFIFSCNYLPQSKGAMVDLKPNDSIGERISAHKMHELKFGHINSVSEEYWDSLNHVTHSASKKNMGTLRTDYKTFGWHIYSNGSAYKEYNFKLLWGISYFAYSVNPENGSYKKIHQWKTTALIDSAKANDCKVFLTITNFGQKENEQFLSNAKSQQTLIDSVLTLLKLREADGINIDFESIPASSKNQFTAFIKRITQSLKKANPKYQVSVCLYAIDFNHIFDIKAINPYIDFYTMMGYDYYGGFSTYAGPVTPLKSSKTFGQFCLEYSVKSYLQKGVIPSKLIVGLPYYGAGWNIKDTSIISKSLQFNSHKSYKTIKSTYIDSDHTPVLFDSISLTNYCNINLKNGEYEQLWFEDVQSLTLKYDWIKKQKLGGVAIWALGDDNGYHELWDLMLKKFGKE